MGRRVFRPTATGTLLALLGLAVFVSLGRWQMARMHEKQALFAAFESTAGEVTDLDVDGNAPFQRVRLAGRYDSDRQILLDNMTHEGRAGFQVLTPLRRDSGATVLVNRGWVPQGARRSDIPGIAVGTQPRAVTGRVHALPRPGIRVDGAAAEGERWPRVMSYPTIDDVRKALETEVDERVILLDPRQPDGFVREWRASTFPPERHLGYAITWFALAATVLIAFVVTALAPREAQA